MRWAVDQHRPLELHIPLANKKRGRLSVRVRLETDLQGTRFGHGAIEIAPLAFSSEAEMVGMVVQDAEWLGFD